MSEDHGNGPGVTVEVHAGAEPAGEGGAGNEVVEGAAVEPVAEAAVEIARIEGETAVTLAAIEAETSLEHHELGVREMEALTELNANSELEECRTQLAAAEAANLALTAEVARLTPPPSEALPPSLAAEPEAEPSVEVVGPRENLEPAPEPEKPKRKPHRWI